MCEDSLCEMEQTPVDDQIREYFTACHTPGSKSVTRPRTLGAGMRSFRAWNTYKINSYNFLFCIEWFYKMYNAIDITTQDIIDCISVSEESEQRQQ